MRNKPQTSAEAAEELRHAWRKFILTVAVSLRLDKACEWLADKLTKEGRK